MAIAWNLAILIHMKKLHITPVRLLVAVLIFAVVVVGAGYAYKVYTSPYKGLTSEQKKAKKKLDTFENCLVKAQNMDAEPQVIEDAMEACRAKYPDV